MKLIFFNLNRMFYMVDGKKGLIDDQLSTLLLDFFNKINSLQMQTHTATPLDSLSQKEIQVIESLADRKLPMSELSEMTNVKNSTLTQIADKLVKKQYLARAFSENDRRMVIVHLTAKGMQLWKNQADLKKKTIDSILDRLQFEEQVALMNALTKIKAL
jgi:DNA-binding MarR family transcriptional regulator